MVDMYNTEDESVYENTAPDKPKSLPWSEQAAAEHGERLALATANPNQEETDMMIEEYKATGQSATADRLTQELRERDKALSVDVASELVGEFDPASILEVIQKPDERDDQEYIDERAAMNAAASSPEAEAWSEEEFDAIIDNEMQIQQEVRQIRAEHEPFPDGALKGIADFMGALVPFNESNSWRRLINEMEDEFGVEFGVGAGAMVTQGEYVNTVRNWFDGLDTEEQAEALRFLTDTLPEVAGTVHRNDFIASSMLSSITEKYDAGEIDGFDSTRVVDNVATVLEVVGLGSTVKAGVGAIKAGRKALIERGSNAASLERTNPEAAAAAEAAVVAGDTDKANRLGTTAEEIIADKLMPKWEGYDNTPHVSEGFFQSQLDRVNRILSRESELDLHLTDAEKDLQVENLRDILTSTKTGTLRSNSSKLVRVSSQRIDVNASYGKTDSKGFASEAEADKFLQKLKRSLPAAEGKVVAKQYDGSTTATKQAQGATQSLDEVISTLRTRLTTDAGGKSSKGAVKAQGKEYRRLKRELSRSREMLRGLRNPSSNVSKQLKAEAQARLAQIPAGKNALAKTQQKKLEKEIQEEIRDMETRIAGIDNRVKQEARAAEASSNLSRLEAGQFDKLTGYARDVYNSALRAQAKADAKAVQPDPKREYFVEVQYTQDFGSQKGVTVKIDDIIGRGDKAGYFQDISAGLAKHLSDSFYRAFDRSRGLEKELISLLKPFVSASNANRRRILSILDDGSKYQNADGSIGKNFTADEVLAALPQDISRKDAQQVVEGYIAVRQMADISYMLMSQELRKDLVGEGYQAIKAGDRDLIGKRVNDENPPSHAFDPESGEIVEISKEQRDSFKAQGTHFYETKKMNGTGTNMSKYVIVRPTDQVDALPRDVLNYRPGYIPRIYKEQYFVTMRPKAARIEGKKVSESEIPVQTIAVAKSLKEAKQQVEALSASSDMVVDWKHARELTTGQARDAELDLHMNTGGMFYGKRGDHLSREGGDLADTENAVGAITAMAANISRRMDLEPVIDLHKRRWLDRFGHLTNGKFPNTSEIIAKAGRVSDDELAAAKAYWGYIDVQSSNASVAQWWRTTSFKFGEWLEGKGADRLGSMFRTTVAEKDPFQFTRGFTFLTSIVLNPFRQLFIQSQQILFLAGIDAAGISSGKVTRGGMALLMAREDNMAQMAKVAGMSESELQKTVQAFRDSGLVEAVDSHLIGRDALMAIDAEVKAGKVGQLWQGASNQVKKGFNAVRRVGFDTGELFNISQTYIVAQRRWKKNNPGKDPFTREAQFEIAADTRQLALGMTSAGAYKFQRGVLSLPTQFLSVQAKAASAMIGANKALTKAEARKVAIGQTLLYGATGIGLGSVLDWALEETGTTVNPDVRNVLLGGIYDFTLNTMIQNASGNNYAFAANIAAGGGWADTLTDKLADFQDLSALEMFLGPSSTPFSRFGDAMSLTRAVYGAKLMGERPTVDAEDAADVVNAWASLASFWNNAAKGVAMVRSESMVGKDLSEMGVPASMMDAAIRAVIGVGTHEEDANYQFLISDSERRKKVKELAQAYVQRTNKRFALWEEQSNHPAVDKMVKMFNQESLYLRARYGDSVAEQIFRESEKLFKLQEKGPTSLTDRLFRAVQNGGGYNYTTWNEMVTNLQNGGLVDADTADQLRQLRTVLWQEEETE